MIVPRQRLLTMLIQPALFGQRKGVRGNGLSGAEQFKNIVGR